MPVKRALKLDSLTMGKVPATKLGSSKKNLHSYSPTTGTCLMSPFSSPRSSNVQVHRNGLSNGKRDKSEDVLFRSSRKRQPEMEENDKLLVLHSEAEESLERFIQIRRNLTSLQYFISATLKETFDNTKSQRDFLLSTLYVYPESHMAIVTALEGTKELENIIGISDNSGNLKSEVRKTRKLIEQAKKQKLLKRSNIRLPTQEYHQPVSTFEFLKSLID